MTADLSDYIQRLRDALTSIDPFSHTVQGDDYCLWCRRDRPRDAKDFDDLKNPDHHDADCEYSLALAEPVPLALHDAQVRAETWRVAAHLVDGGPSGDDQVLVDAMNGRADTLEAEARKGAASDEVRR
jgi:hypothetical protein